MSRLTCILSITLMVVHLTVDCCCACHAHACESECSLAIRNAEALEVKGLECLCDHSHHGPLECRSCDSSTALPTRIVGRPKNQKVRAIFVASTAADLPRPSIRLAQKFRVAGNLLLPIRLHLANQVLLI
jgi:hypothetical protein